MWRVLLVALAAALSGVIGAQPVAGGAAVTGQVSGVVNDVGGAALADVTVAALAADGSVLAQTVTDAAGAWSLSGMSVGSVVVVRYDAPAPLVSEFHDNAATFEAAVPITVDGTNQVVSAVLDRLGQVSGAVTLSDFTAAADASVELVDATTGATAAQATTTPTGDYSLAAAPGSYRLRFNPPAGRDEIATYFNNAYRPADATLLTLELNSSTFASEQLALGGVLVGTVTSGVGAVVPNVLVTAWDAVGGGFVAQTSTDTNGVFALETLPASPVVIQYSPPVESGLAGEFHNNATTQIQATPITVVGIVEMSAELARAATVAGTVTTASGDASASTSVTLTGINSSAGRFYSVVTDAGGSYLFGNVAAGTYRLCFDAPAGTNFMRECFDSAPTESEATPLVIVDGVDVVHDAVLALGGAISGTVIGSNGVPVSGASVTASSVVHSVLASTVTDATGAYVIRGLLPSSYRVQFNPPADSPDLSEFFDGAANSSNATFVGVAAGVETTAIDATLVAGASISGVLTDSVSGAPIVNASIYASGAGTSVWALSDATGNFTIRPLSAGSYDVTANALGYLSLSFGTPFSVLAGEQVTGADRTMVSDNVLAGGISGVISDAAGAPVQGAFVYASGPGYASGYTDASGVFSLSGLVPGEYRVSASATGMVAAFYPGVVSYQSATPVTVTAGQITPSISFALAAGGRISGTITTEDGASAEAVSVSATRIDDPSVAVYGYVTASTNQYEIANVPPGSYRVRFDAYQETSPYLAQYFPGVDTQAAATAVVVVAGESTTGIDATLTLGGTISGTVTNAAGDPLRNIDVNVSGPDYRWMRTDTNGRYTIRRLPAGSYTVWFTSPAGSNYLDEYWPDQPSPDSATPVTVTRGVATSGIDAVLSAGFGLSGRITGPGGVAVSSGTVIASAMGGGSSSGSATIQPDGTYAVLGLAPGSYCVWVQNFGLPAGLAGGYYGTTGASCNVATPVVLSTADATGIDIALLLGGTISGRVTNAVGVPITDVWVSFGDGFSTGGSATTDADGRYTIVGLPSSNGRVMFSTHLISGYLTEYYNDQSQWHLADSLTVAPGTALTGIDAVLADSGALSGVVTGPNGAPVAGVSVQAEQLTPSYSWQSVSTNGSGAYSFANLPVGTYRLKFVPTDASGLMVEYYNDAVDEAAAASVVVSARSTTTTNAQLALGAVIRGTVTDEADAGVGVAYVTAYRVTSTGDVFARSVAVDALGGFTIGGLPAGGYKLHTNSGTFVSEYFDNAATLPAATVIQLSNAQVRDDIAIRLAPRGSVSGVVRDAAGAPLAGVFVRLEPASNPFGLGSLFATTGADGSYSIPGVIPGAHALHFGRPFDRRELASEWSSNAYARTAASTVTVVSGANVVVNEALAVGGVISGVITGPDGQPLADAWVSVSGPNGFGSATSAVDGAYRIEGLPPGTVDLSVSPPWNSLLAPEWYENAYSQATAQVITVVLSGSFTANVQLEVGATISGRLLDSAGQPVPFTCVTSSAFDGGEGCSGYSDETGAYRFTQLQPGSYVLCTERTLTLGAICNGGKVSRFGATATAVTLGQNVTGVDLVMPVVGTLSGLLLDESGAAMEGGVWFEDAAAPPGSTEPGAGFVSYDYVPLTGYSITLSPGTYRVHASDGVRIAQSGPVVVTSGATTTANLRYVGIPPAPGTPVGVAGDRSVVLTWTAPTGDGGAPITDYVVEYSANAGTTWSTFADGVRAVTGATVTGLVNGTSYRFRVSAVNVRGAGALSAASAAAVPRTVPGTPTAVVGAPGAARAVLTWAAPASTGGSAITDYVVQFSSNAGTTWTMFNDGVRATTGATVTGLVNGTSYVFRVSARNVAGTSAASLKSAAVVPRTVPGASAAPTGVIGHTKITLAWAAPTSNGGSAITDYVVQFSSNAGSTWATFNDGVRATTGATVTGLVNGRSYVFRVAARNVAGTGASSVASATLIPRAVTNPPAAPTGTPGNARVVLAWPAPAAVAGVGVVTDYVVQFSSNAGSTWTTFADGVRATTGATVTGLVNGRSYVFRVAARNAAGVSGYSVKSAALVPRTVPGVPGLPKGTAGIGRVVLTWTAPVSNGGSAITDYVVQFSSNAGVTWTTFADGVRATTGATVTGLVKGRSYVFRIAARNVAGTGVYTAKSVAAIPK